MIQFAQTWYELRPITASGLQTPHIITITAKTSSLLIVFVSKFIIMVFINQINSIG